MEGDTLSVKRIPAVVDCIVEALEGEEHCGRGLEVLPGRGYGGHGMSGELGGPCPCYQTPSVVTYWAGLPLPPGARGLPLHV